MEVGAAVIDPDKDASTADLLKAAVEEARDLIKLEVELAKSDVASELARAKAATITLTLAAGALNLALAMVLFAVAVASHAEIVVSIAAAGGLFVFAAVAGVAGVRKLPATILDRTRERLGDDIRQLEERVHGS